MGVTSKEGSFDIMESAESKKGKRVSMLKNILIAALVIAVIALAICLGKAKNGSPTPNEDGFTTRPLPPTNSKSRGNVCMSRDCIKVADTLYDRMNLNASPCDDFYEFACGNFMKETIIPEDKTSWNSFSPLSDTILERGRKLLEEENDDEWNIVKQAKSYYKSCMGEEKLEEVGVKPLTDALEDVLGGWPVLKGSSWDSSAFKWDEAVYKMASRGYGKDYIVSASVGTDDKNSSWRAIFLDQPSLGLKREYLIKGFDDKDVQHYFTYMKETAVKLLGGDEATVDADLANALRFEIKLAEASLPREERRDFNKLYNPEILKNFAKLPGHPESWVKYVNTVISDVEITDDERVIVAVPTYFEKVSSILNETPKKTVANYLGWRLAKSVMSSMNKAAAEIKLKFDKEIYGQLKNPPRWKKCTKAVGFNSYSDSNFRIAAGAMYAKKHFPEAAKKAMLELIGYLKQSFGDILDKLDWMDDTTKDKARIKLRTMDKFIGYPDEILNENTVEAHHSGLNMNENDYFGNNIQLIKWQRKFKNGRLREKVDKKNWIDHSLVALVNAFYDPSKNAMEFPAGILQGIFYNHLAPNYLNFGGIGAVIGHEITHGFDDQGRQYDEDGNLFDWWQPTTKKKFLEKTKCIIKQYSDYVAEQVGINLNGITTQGENIADNGGIKESYYAYNLWLENQGKEEQSLPGLPFTPKQLYWINWGQVWCVKYRDSALKNQVKTAAHSPGQFRIIGPLSNSDEFARDFGCAKSAPMNPDVKCTVW